MTEPCGVSSSGAHWYVVQIDRDKHVPASEFMKTLGFEPYIPVYEKHFLRRRRLVKCERMLFGTYGFARFDVTCDPWHVLSHWKAARYGIHGVLHSMTEAGDPRPTPLPDKAIDLVRGFTPSEEPKMQAPYIFQPGEPCLVVKAGTTKHAIFDSYSGDRQFVRMWILGANRLVRVSQAELQPLDIDTGRNVVANSAA